MAHDILLGTIDGGIINLEDIDYLTIKGTSVKLSNGKTVTIDPKDWHLIYNKEWTLVRLSNPTVWHKIQQLWKKFVNHGI